MELYIVWGMFFLFVFLLVAEIIWAVIGYKPHEAVAIGVLRKHGVLEYDKLFVKSFLCRIVRILIYGVVSYVPLETKGTFNVYACVCVDLIALWFYGVSYYSFVSKKDNWVFINTIWGNFLPLDSNIHSVCRSVSIRADGLLGLHCLCYGRNCYTVAADFFDLFTEDN